MESPIWLPVEIRCLCESQSRLTSDWLFISSPLMADFIALPPGTCQPVFFGSPSRMLYGNRNVKYCPERHHRRSIRLRDYDYSRNGAYYVTICTRNRDCILSKIDSGTVGAGLAPALHVEASESIVRLTKAGEIAQENWLEIPERYADVYLDEFEIMPNLLHGIILFSANSSRATARVAPTLGQIIGSYKSKCVIEYLNHIDANDINAIAKMWQRNYYEHVIRNEDELNKTREYIHMNPYRWADDEEHPDNIEKMYIIG